MLNVKELKYTLRDAVSRLSAKDVKATAGFESGYGAFHFTVPEEVQKILNFPLGINSETASVIFNIGVRQICNQMIENESVLTEKMLSSACQTIVDNLQDSKGKHLFIFFVPSITLAVKESIEIGGTTLRKASVADAELLEGRADIILERNVGSQGPTDKKDFLNRYLNSTLVQLRFSGFHYKDELSFPAHEAWKTFGRVAAYLMICKEVLQIPEKYPDYGRDHKSWPWDAFMVGKRGRAPLIPIYSTGHQFSIYGLDFEIDPHLLYYLYKYCYLQEFNRLCKSHTELRDKIYRSLDWFLKGCREDDPTDQLVCSFISLECLFGMGSDSLSSQTGDLAENIALLIHSKRPERIEEKNFFKKKVYPLRNRIMHHGHMFEAKDEPVSDRLKVYIMYGVINILKHLDAITKDGGLRNFFEKVKMTASI
jgi:hypothetical protein